MTKLDAQHLDEWLSAYLDGELTEKEAQLVEGALREDESARRRLTDLRRTVSLVTGLPRHAAPPTLADEILARLERTELLGDVEQSNTLKPRRRWRVPMWTSLAAALGLSVLGGWWMFLSPQRPSSVLTEAKLSPSTGEKDATASPAALADGTATESDRIASRGAVPTRSSDEKLAFADKRERLAKLTSNEGTSGPTKSNGKSATLETAAKSVVETTTAPSGTLRDDVSSPSADLNTKLASGFDAGKVRTHRYRDESVRLRVQVRSGETVERVADAVRSRLVEFGVPDLEGDAVSSGNGRMKTPSRFFQRGRAGDNFDETDSRQLIARVRATDVEAVLSGLPKLGVRDADVHMSAGALSFKGSESVRGMLKSSDLRSPSTDESVPRVAGGSEPTKLALSGPSAEREAASSNSDSSMSKRRARTSDQWTELLEVFSKTFTSPPNTSAAPSTGPAPPTASDAELLAYGPPCPNGARVDAADGNRSAGSVGAAGDATSTSGLVSRRIEAARSGGETAMANRPVTIEPSPPPNAKVSNESNAGDLADAEANDEPLITLVIEVSVAPNEAPASHAPASPPRLPDRPVKPPPGPPTIK